MAKQTGDYKITGTYDDVTYYQVDGQYYARKKSSLKGDRVKRDPRFKRTMEWAHRLAQGSQLASKVYRSLPKLEQVYALYKELKSLAIRALKEGKNEAEATVLLQLQVGKTTTPVAHSKVGEKKPTGLRITPSFTRQLSRVLYRRRKKVRQKRPLVPCTFCHPPPQLKRV